MRVRRLVWTALALIVALPGMALPVNAQDSGGEFVLGARLLVVTGPVPVYVKPDLDSTVVEELQINMLSQITAMQEDDDGTVWYYLRDNAYGWVPSLLAGASPLVVYTDELLDQRIAEATAAIEANPEDIAAYAARGMAYFSAGDHYAAEADYTRAIELDPENGVLYDFRAKIYLDMHGPGSPAFDAYLDLQKAIQYGRGLVNTYNRLGIANERLDSFSDAIDAYEQAIALEPGYGLLYNNLGVTYGHMGDTDRLLALYTQAIEIDPHLSFTYVNRGREYVKQNRLQEALNDFDQAIQVDPFFARAYLWRGIMRAHYIDIDPKAAFDDFNQAIQLDPSDSDAFMNRGTSYMSRGDMAAAITDLEHAIALNQANEPAWANLGTAYALTGQYEKAIDSYTWAIGLYGAFMTTAYVYRAQVYLAVGDLDSALGDLSDYLEIVGPSYPYALVGYLMEGNVLLYRGEYMRAASDYERAYEINPTLAQNYGTWVGDWRVTGDREDRLAELENQLNSDPDNAELYRQVGHMYMEFGRWQDAMRAYNRYVALVGDPGSEFSRFLERIQPLYAPVRTPSA
jgi:tetratricopeptide (TPR) repeat protein